MDYLRQEIDGIDKELLELFQKRMKTCAELAEYKKKKEIPILDESRERQKLAMVTEQSEEGMTDYNRNLFGVVMDLSKAYQQKLNRAHSEWEKVISEAIENTEKTLPKYPFVACQGVEGAYSFGAMKEFFDDTITSFHVDTWKEAMEAITRGEADYAVLPIENSTAGIVSDIYDLLVEYPHYIVGEQELPVEHVLMALPGAKAEEIRTVISHPQALAQCRRFLDSNENWKTEERLNTAAAAKEVSESGDLTMAAVGSPYAAEHFGLQILKEGIFDAQGNTTRFVIISGQKRFVKDAQKISVCMELPHQSGSLYNALAHFIYNDLNMTKIESRPIPQRKWEYRFFVDFEGNLSDPAVKNALRGLQAESAKFRIFGNY